VDNPQERLRSVLHEGRRGSRRGACRAERQHEELAASQGGVVGDLQVPTACQECQDDTACRPSEPT
jgi:hypothetical protein